ncbi:MAG: hypothetical protein K8R59_04380 [Thermoanaerobaculales bacterium]|nr:hypothetical protein [Thermoanaerobaculales bacterium]
MHPLRFRIDSTGGLSAGGLALDGEVEDEQVEIMIGADLAVTMSDMPDPVISRNRQSLTRSNGTGAQPLEIE